jgi:hypothetical protein
MFRETNNSQIAVHEDTKKRWNLSISSDVPDLKQLAMMSNSKTYKGQNAEFVYN